MARKISTKRTTKKASKQTALRSTSRTTSRRSSRTRDSQSRRSAPADALTLLRDDHQAVSKLFDEYERRKERHCLTAPSTPGAHGFLGIEGVSPKTW